MLRIPSEEFQRHGLQDKVASNDAVVEKLRPLTSLMTDYREKPSVFLCF